MSNVGNLWERLVRAALRRERTGIDAYGRPAGGIAGNVPSSLSNSRDIDPILTAADEIQDEDPNISTILGEYAYALAQNLDPNSEGTGVLQFKTGLMSVIRQKLAKREGGSIDRSREITCLQDFYKLYREKNNVDKLREEEMELRESGTFSGNFQELERKTVKRKRVFATLKVIGTVLEQLAKEVSPEEAQGLISEELKRMMESDAAMTEDLIAYNIIPLDAPVVTNVITSFPENILNASITKRRGKTSFVEHRTFFHLYHSFDRLWIFLFMMFQGLTIIAFNNGKLNDKTIREVLSLGPTFFVMKLFQSALDIVVMYRAYSTTKTLAVSRIVVRFIWFTFATIFICFLYVKALQEKTSSNSESIIYKIYIIVLCIYVGSYFFWSSLVSFV